MVPESHDFAARTYERWKEKSRGAHERIDERKRGEVQTEKKTHTTAEGHWKIHHQPINIKLPRTNKENGRPWSRTDPERTTLLCAARASDIETIALMGLRLEIATARRCDIKDGEPDSSPCHQAMCCSQTQRPRYQ